MITVPLVHRQGNLISSARLGDRDLLGFDVDPRQGVARHSDLQVRLLRDVGVDADRSAEPPILVRRFRVNDKLKFLAADGELGGPGD